MRDHRSIPPVPARGGHLLIRLVAVVAMLLATVTVGIQGAAAQDETFTDDDDGVAWSVAYDGDVWTVLDNPAVDLGLTTDVGTTALFVKLAGIVEVEFPTCIDDLVPDFEESVGNLDSNVAEDAGAPIEGNGEGYVWQLRDVTLPDGQEAQIAHACYELSDGGIVWGLVAINPGDLDLAYDVLGAVAVDGEPVVIDFGDGNGSGDDEATPVTGASERPEATPETEASDDAGDSGDADDATTYESEDFGYAFTYDPTFWTTAEQSSFQPGHDLVSLWTDTTDLVLYVEGSDEWTDTEECVSAVTDAIADPTFLDETIDPETGDPLAVSGDDMSIAAYDADWGVLYFACYADPDSDVIVGFSFAFTGDEDPFFGDALPVIQDVTGSLEFTS